MSEQTILTLPLNIYTAAKRIYAELPTLIGDGWTEMQPQLDAHMKAVEAAPTMDDAFYPATQIQKLIRQYPDARTRLSDEMRLQATVQRNIAVQLRELGFDDEQVQGISPLAFIGIQWEADPDTIPQNEDEIRSRTVTMQRDFSDGKSVKFSNFELDTGAFMKLSAEFAMIGQDAIDKPKPFVIAAGVLLVLWTLRGEMTEKLTQQEASVFWGVAVACSHKSPRVATKTTILEKTNAERGKVGLAPLTDDQLQYSLTRLLEVKSIQRVPGQADTYEMIENLRIED
jgi:hypothetical protein